MSTHWHATTIRRNLNGKSDYEWVAKTSDGNPMLFDTEQAALEFALSACRDQSHAMHSPRAIPAKVKP
jgi:hypothetical protein